MGRTIHALKTYRLIFCYVIISLIILIVAYECPQDVLLNNILIAVAVSGLTTATFSVFLNMLERENMSNMMEESFSLLRDVQDYGLVRIDSRFPLEDEHIKNDFINSEVVYIVMNDAKNFFSDNEDLFDKRFRGKDKITHIALLDYENSQLMSLLGQKNGHNGSYYTEKIKNVVEYHIKRYIENFPEHKIMLHLNPNYNTMAVLITENFAMISLYRLALGKTNVPHMTFRKGGKEFDTISKDIVRLCDKTSVQMK